jgi:hypothetical protein
MTRAADVILHIGEEKEAIALFSRADQLQKSIRARPLDGEAARKFVLALVRTRDDDPGRLPRAKELIESNIKRYGEVFAKSLGGVSNDLIPFLVLRAAIQRVEGNLDQAASTLEAIRHHDYVRRGECTYVATAEIEMEQIRLNFVTSGSSSELLERASILRQRLFNAHHHLMAYEAALIAAECCVGAEQTTILKDCKNFLRERQALMRLADTAEIEGNGSAIHRFGL